MTYFNISYELMEVYSKGECICTQEPDVAGRHLATIRVADIVSMTTDDNVIIARGDVTIIYKLTYGAVDCIIDYLASRSDTDTDIIDAATSEYRDKYFEIERDDDISIRNAPVNIDWWKTIK